MLRSAEITCLGTGAALALAPGARGSVVAQFTKATYVRTTAGLCAFASPKTHPGPLHAVLAGPIPYLEVGTSVDVDATHVVVGDRLLINGDNARRWVGAHPEASALATAREAAGAALDPVSERSVLRSAPYRDAIEGWLERLTYGDLESVARRLGGVGPGLTPAGDDALSGVLMVARVLWTATAEVRLLRCAALARTTELSGAFLVWAARGQSLAPVHDLLRAVAEGDHDRANRSARVLAEVGASSGADLCLGVSQALRRLPLS